MNILRYKENSFGRYELKINEGNRFSFSYDEHKKYDAIAKQLAKHRETCAVNRRKRKKRKK